MFRASDPLSGIESVPWTRLGCAYEEGWRIPAILRRLAASDSQEVERGWDEVNEQILWHQGTVYPATQMAVPFIARIAATPQAQRRPRLISLLAQLSLGTEAPDWDVGTVRRAVRQNLPILHDFVETFDRPLALAMSHLAAALPFDMRAALPMVTRLFAEEADLKICAALAGAIAMLGDRPPEVMDLLRRVEEQSVYQAVRLSGGLVMHPPAGERSRYKMEDIVGMPVHTAIAAWTSGSPPVIENHEFLEVADLVHRLFVNCMDLIWNAP